MPFERGQNGADVKVARALFSLSLPPKFTSISLIICKSPDGVGQPGTLCAKHRHRAWCALPPIVSSLLQGVQPTQEPKKVFLGGL